MSSEKHIIIGINEYYEEKLGFLDDSDAEEDEDGHHDQHETTSDKNELEHQQLCHTMNILKECSGINPYSVLLRSELKEVIQLSPAEIARYQERQEYYESAHSKTSFWSYTSPTCWGHYFLNILKDTYTGTNDTQLCLTLLNDMMFDKMGVSVTDFQI